MFYYIYILQSAIDKRLYVGYTRDLRKRLSEHNRGLVFATKPFAPYILIHFEGYRNVDDVKRREKYLKTSTGMRLLKRMLREFLYINK